ncbi:MAG: potassium transporter TrkG [archaeon]
MKTLAANMGFTLQLAGGLMLPSIVAGLALEETAHVVSLFCAATAFLFLGFLLNSLAEKRRLDVGQAAFLVAATFLVLSLIGAVPYFISVFGEGNILERVANAFFESVSGYTTTGFSFIPDEAVLPISIQIYRVTTEFVGGIGLVFLLLAFLHTDTAVSGLESALGTEEIGAFSPRKKYFEIFSVYTIYIVALSATLYFVGYKSILRNVMHIIHLITGGYASSPQFLPGYLQGAGLVVALLTMFIGAISFVFHHRLITGKLARLISWEVVLFGAIVAGGAFSLASQAGGFLSGLFQALSFSSGTGISLVPLSSYGEYGKLVLIVLMFIGGCGFSMAGGIKVSRLIFAARGVVEMVVRYVKGAVPSENSSYETRAGRERTAENLSALVSISLGVILTISSAVLLMLFLGAGFFDSLFETVSAYSTTGATGGLVSVANPVWMKLLFSGLMLLGRIDLVVFLIAIGYFAYSLSSRGTGPGEKYLVEVSRFTEGENAPVAKRGAEKGPSRL